jgi:SAM-dependent methyltransferase
MNDGARQSEFSGTLLNGWQSIEEIVRIKQGEPDGLRLDLGCGFVKPAGFIGMDNFIGSDVQFENDENPPDIVMDINSEPWPFPDECCEEVRSSHFLEHSNLDHVFLESFRVLKPGGIFFFVVPYANSAEGMFPGHSIFLTEQWFHKNMTFQDRFRIIDERFDPSESYMEWPWLLRKVVPFDFARRHLFNVCSQMWIQAVVRK